jgi:hypothetical protein
VSPGNRYEMGSRVPFSKDLQFRGQAPLPAKWKLFRSGKVVAESTGRTFEYTPTGPGIYRTEAWLTVAGEDMPWVLSNPLYLR